MIEKQQFCNQIPPKRIDLEYRDCNFSQKTAVFRDNLWKGVILFPDDPTPRMFVHCNLINCEPPPGSTLIKCNCAIICPEILVPEEEVTLIGDLKVTMQHLERIVYGKHTEAGYVYLPKPKAYPWEREV